MYPDSVFAVPVGSFRYPVPIVDEDPTGLNTVQVCFNSSYAPYIAGALKQLLLQTTWDTDDPSVLSLQQQRVTNLISLFAGLADGCGIPVPGKLCLSGTFADADYGYLPDSGMVCTNPYVIGTGFVSCDDGSGNQIINVGRHFTGLTSIESYDFDFSTGVFAGNETVSIQWSAGGSVVRTDTFTLLPTNRHATSTTPVTADAVDIFASFLQTIPVDSMVLDTWSMCYDGVFPLSTPPETFAHAFDFTVSDGGTNVGSVPHGSYSAGVGWVAAVDGDPSATQLRVWLNPNAAFVCTSLEQIWSWQDLDGSDAGVVRGFSGFESGSSLMGNPGANGDHSNGTDQHSVAVGPQTIRSVIIGTDCHTGSGGFETVTGLIVRGLGIDPFA